MRKGLLPEILEDLLSARKKAKEDMKKVFTLNKSYENYP